MRQLFKQLIRSALARRGRKICRLTDFPTTTTTKDELLQFIQRLRPVMTGHELIRL